ncbi:Snf7-domain-containing protein [Microstroma glucosiphilum]|uniref:Snf7-domain-containing protein n=1 Tax=Pseudomicrostroma glucosiphilum TaxID=1684307 RepID=A0A316U969_9BASI|nr:Snf7-domain-containing protein [Pseudomicrostroma glucosiphilum]PWN21699.1 Snf7-domain-containing protein [Pseudomicrostroma glucosiphilum]
MSSIINTLFGTRKTPAEKLRQHQRALQKAQRELDRERTKLEQQEKKLVAEIRQNAKQGQMSACKIQAKDLVRTRKHIQKFYQMKTQLQAVSLRIQTLRSNQQMGEAMKGATKAMGMMNRSMNLPQVQRIMREFERESEVMDMKEEMMSDAVDQAMDDEADGIGEEEEGDAILKEVLDSIGVDLSQSLGEAPTASLNDPIAAPQRVAIGEEMGAGVGGAGGGGTSDEDALQARLDMLRRD